ncbi:type VI secretion system Vgr family protein [Paraburkholderia sp.]|uniref:type VI secretion system Vgr family protein n=1 Tax=Paraburkholderia sp. TaxID=1926495 RepID=UPI002D28BF5E|nr:type VI secretion system tip protein TssI/VgrG [Paraburkholderia sp.]HZZ03404.1 type VI secretion system tip protein TssI/VgrG [Paraburkholderia sp.]
MSILIQPRTLAVSGSALPTHGLDGLPVLCPVRLRGTETLGKLFEYTLVLKTADALAFAPSVAANIELDKLIGTEVTVSIELEGNGQFFQGMSGQTDSGNAGAQTREITGVVTSARIVREEDRSIVYELVLRPWLWLATKNQNCRLFQDLDVVEITEAVLSAYTFPVEKRLFGPSPRTPYPKRDVQCQYWESDWTFLQRLWEEWGIYYWFEYSDGKHRLVLADAMAANHPHDEGYGTIRYQGPTGQRLDREHVHTLAVQNGLTAGSVSSVDYDYTRPRADLTAKYEDPRDTAQARQEIYAWGDFAQPQAGATGLTGERNQPQSEAEHLSRVRLQAFRCVGSRAKGRGNLRSLVVGRTFALTHYPQTAANREYLVVSATLDIEETGEASGTGQRYRCTTDFEIQPASETFRLARTIEKPRTSGPQSATVVGPENQEIWTDAYGRVKVQFTWDRRGLHDQRSSCWVRVSSPWQGNQFGATHLPRIGEEVLVDHLNGDPDLPIVTGRAVNAFQPPAWTLPDNQALSGFRSRELGGGRSNHLVQDDTPGEIQTQLSSDHGASQLSLGFLRRVLGNKGRQDARGEGYELRTDFWGVLRAAKGMLVTTEARQDAQSHAKDMGETVARLRQAFDLHEDLAGLAQQHGAQQRDADQSDVTKVIKEQNHGLCGGTPTNDNAFPEFAEPHLTLSSPAGIQTTTAASTHIASDENLALTTGGHVAVATGASFFVSVANAFSLFVHKLGITLVAASGKVRVEAQNDRVEIIAQRAIEIMSTDGWIELKAKLGIRINGGGSEVEITRGGIVGSTVGSSLVHAASHGCAGPMTKPIVFPGRPERFCERCFLIAARSGSAIVPQ